LVIVTTTVFAVAAPVETASAAIAASGMSLRIDSSSS
jgi:hypothetical protein